MAEKRMLFEPSSTVNRAINTFSSDEDIRADQLTQAILDGADHRQVYAGGSFESMEISPTDEVKQAQQWLDEIQELFAPDRFPTSSKAQQLPILHGRLAIIGLAILDRQLYQQLEQINTFSKLVGELEEPVNDITEILSEYGREVYDQLFILPVIEIADSVPNWQDDPLTKIIEDKFARAAFARFLARRLGEVPQSSGAYAVHLYGPWGSGKSTLLNFLKAELTEENKSDQPWVVIEFNAWRNQHIDPPWWSLMEAVFQEAKGKLSWKDRIREYWWRLTSGRVLQIFSGIVLLWIFVLGFGWARQNIPPTLGLEGETGLGVISQIAKTVGEISQIIALIATVWGGIVAVNQSLLLGSAQAASTYKQRVQDPMNEIKGRFQKLIERLSPIRVAVFIDDLDRCQSSFVVELLEGIQTIFREAPVVYIVAADRRWLNACYTQEYQELDDFIEEPGKSLGTLFLEKAFRFSTPMPGIPDALKDQYWQYLLQLRAEETSIDWTIVRQNAKQALSTASDEELDDIVENSKGMSFAEQQAILEEAVVRLATPEIYERLEHTLNPYADLLDPNPRSMKRLVNAYSANRALAILSRKEIERHQLVLWTILMARWPKLAMYLEGHPEMINRVGSKNPPGKDETLKILFDDEEVKTLVNGGSLGRALQKQAIWECAQMHA